mmetsp:Transcript_21350/g.44993  ORF Transcript_21350/g.44993 Transcript_21350/m.44993 type:complete len:241 (+) Transcript_21350:554-1276(+)
MLATTTTATRNATTTTTTGSSTPNTTWTTTMICLSTRTGSPASKSRTRTRKKKKAATKKTKFAVFVRWPKGCVVGSPAVPWNEAVVVASHLIAFDPRHRRRRPLQNALQHQRASAAREQSKQVPWGFWNRGLDHGSTFFFRPGPENEGLPVLSTATNHSRNRLARSIFDNASCSVCGVFSASLACSAAIHSLDFFLPTTTAAMNYYRIHWVLMKYKQRLVFKTPNIFLYLSTNRNSNTFF